MIIDILRSAREWAGIAAGYAERVSDISTNVYQEDIRLADRPTRKWYRTKRRPEDVTAVCLHVTAVAGGFGARRRDIERHLERGVLPDRARVLAQSDRFLSVPYHAISSNALVFNLETTVVSWHGHGANTYSLGYAVDMHTRDPLDIRREQDRFSFALKRWAMTCPDLRWLEAHRQHSAMRANDPSARVFRALHEVALDHGLDARPNHTTWSGRPIPPDWLYGSGV